MTYDRGQDSTNALTEIRTVLSRAETALLSLERERARAGTPLDDWQLKYADPRTVDEDNRFIPDPDIEDMINSLNDTVRRLDKYRRTGRTKR